MRGKYIVRLRKTRATWDYFVENPVGGGCGSNYCGPKRIALTRALVMVPAGADYELITNGKSGGVFRKEAE
jgi:hypothetical protein